MDPDNIYSAENVAYVLKNCGSIDKDYLRTVLCISKTVLKNSAKLKNEIRFHINDLIETLKERERQLLQEIKESEIDCVLEMTDRNCENLAAENTHPSIDEHPKVPSSAFLLKFVGDPDALKTKLQQFGQIEMVKEVSFESCGCEPRRTHQVKKHRCTVGDLLKTLSTTKTKKAQNESTGSTESFEIIEGIDLDEYQKSLPTVRDDDIEVVSNSDENQSCLSNSPICGIEFLSGHKDVISPVYNAPQDDPSSSGQDPMQSAEGEKTADPVIQFHKQLQGLLQSSCNAKGETSQMGESLSNQSFLLEQKSKSDEPSLETQAPSAIIKETFNQYLDQGSSEKWLASTDN